MSARGSGGSDTSWRVDLYAVTRACAAVSFCHPSIFIRPSVRSIRSIDPIGSDRSDRIGLRARRPFPAPPAPSLALPLFYARARAAAAAAAADDDDDDDDDRSTDRSLARSLDRSLAPSIDRSITWPAALPRPISDELSRRRPSRRCFPHATDPNTTTAARRVSFLPPPIPPGGGGGTPAQPCHNDGRDPWHHVPQPQQKHTVRPLSSRQNSEPRCRLVHFGSPPHRHRQRQPDMFLIRPE